MSTDISIYNTEIPTPDWLHKSVISHEPGLIIIPLDVRQVDQKVRYACSFYHGYMKTIKLKLFYVLLWLVSGCGRHIRSQSNRTRCVTVHLIVWLFCSDQCDLVLQSKGKIYCSWFTKGVKSVYLGRYVDVVILLQE